MIPISAITHFDGYGTWPQVLRVPLTAVSGAYREIVYEPIRDRRVWIKWKTGSGSPTFEEGYFPEHSEKLAYGEILFDNSFSRPSPAIDIFSRAAEARRTLYQAPDENATTSEISPESPELQAYRQHTGTTHSGLYFQQIRNGFGEVWLMGYGNTPPQFLGWLKLQEAGYQRFADYRVAPYYISHSRSINIFRLGDLTKTRTLYQRPQEDAPTFVLELYSRDDAPSVGEVFMTEIVNGFVLLCELVEFTDDFERTETGDPFCEEWCGDPFCEIIRPLGWLKIRDAENRLTIWPTQTYTFDMGC